MVIEVPVKYHSNGSKLSKHKKAKKGHGKRIMKPLETILCKPMVAAPLRLQAIILKLSGYDLKVEYLFQARNKF